jgi:glycerol uptake facilitator-like aquaporin
MIDEWVKDNNTFAPHSELKMKSSHEFLTLNMQPNWFENWPIRTFAIGLGLTLIHLISIPITNTSVNPARSTGVAIYAGDWAVNQLWLFWIAPIVGAILGAGIYRIIGSEKE